MLELFKEISLDKEANTALYIQLYTKLKDMIGSGTLLAEYRLPSIRGLSDILNVNPVTVVSAFKRLESEGYIYSRPGSGTYVADMPIFATRRGNPENNIILDELYQQDDFQLINNGQIKINQNTINFASATPTPDLFPVSDFKIALNEVLERDKGNAFAYQDSQGFYPLRECIAEALDGSNIRCTPESIQIISGAQQGIDIISKALLKQGDFVITESPTYTGAIAVFKSRGAEILDIEMEEDGPNLKVLEYNLKKYKPKLFYTIPSFQNPTGHSYPNDKREYVLRLADKYNTFVIEDDYISDLDFEGKGFLPFKSMDRNDKVIYIKSFSKIFMPGLRLGFMIVPAGLQSNILKAKHTTDISTSGLIQRAFDQYMRRGYWDRHFNFMYGIYKERYLAITNALDSCLLEPARYFKPGGGLNIWLSLPYGFPVNSLFKNCTNSNIVFAPGRIFYSRSMGQNINNIRLSFAAVYKEDIYPGIRKLCEIIGTIGHNPELSNNLPIL